MPGYIYLSTNLSWKTYIEAMVSSSNRTLDCFRGAPANVRRLLYIILVRTKFDASAISHSHQKVPTDLIESVQSRAIPFILSDYSCLSSVTSTNSVQSLPVFFVRRRIVDVGVFPYSTKCCVPHF